MTEGGNLAEEDLALIVDGHESKLEILFIELSNLDKKFITFKKMQAELDELCKKIVQMNRQGNQNKELVKEVQTHL